MCSRGLSSRRREEQGGGGGGGGLVTSARALTRFNAALLLSAFLAAMAKTTRSYKEVWYFEKAMISALATHAAKAKAKAADEMKKKKEAKEKKKKEEKAKKKKEEGSRGEQRRLRRFNAWNV